MKITKDNDGKYIIDFENLKINVSDIIEFDSINFISDLFNDDVVSEVRNGLWLFEPFRIPENVKVVKQ